MSRYKTVTYEYKDNKFHYTMGEPRFVFRTYPDLGWSPAYIVYPMLINLILLVECDESSI